MKLSSLGKIGCWLAAAVIAFSGVALATPVYNTSVLPADWTGQRTLTTGGGLNSAGSGNNPFVPGTGISWNITFDGMTNVYTYSYSFFAPGGQALAVSHFILELSPGCIEGQGAAATSSCIWQANSEVKFDDQWGQSPSNPGMPAAIYGVKFDTERSTYTFLSDRNPVWGNFYAKKANDGLWNLGLESAYSLSGNTLYFIPRPDTDGHVIPEPGTFVLLGAGLLGLGLLRRRC